LQLFFHIVTCLKRWSNVTKCCKRPQECNFFVAERCQSAIIIGDMQRSCNTETLGRKLSAIVNHQVIPTVAELLRRWHRLYPVVRNRRRCGWVGCLVCGHRVSRDGLRGADYRRRVLRGRHCGPPERDSEDEYVTVCPDCGGRESFGEAANET